MTTIYRLDERELFDMRVNQFCQQMCMYFVGSILTSDGLVPRWFDDRTDMVLEPTEHMDRLKFFIITVIFSQAI